LDDALLKTLERHTTDLVEKYFVLPAPELSKKQESEKSPKEIIKIKREHEEKKQEPTYTIKSTDKAVLEEFDLKSALFKSMHKNKFADRNPANYRLYHALMEALIEDENAMDKEVADTVKDHKRKHDGDNDDNDDDEGLLAGSNQGKSTKRRRTRESESAKKPSTTKESSKDNVPLEIRRDQVDDLMPTIEEGEVVEEFRARNDARMVSEIFGYPSDREHDKKICINCAHNLKFSCMIGILVTRGGCFEQLSHSPGIIHQS
ncbi:hypothetical protein Tco_0160553, partial [Tanacetum coccineum]